MTNFARSAMHLGRSKAGGVRRRASRRAFGVHRPTALIVGTQKGGTTALFNYLALHPGVAASTKKEVDYFGCDRRFARGTDFYSSFFPERRSPRDDRLSFEASPQYLFVAEKSAARAKDFDPEMRIIAMVRDPVERAFSAWQMYQRFMRRGLDRRFVNWVCDCDGEAEANTYIARGPSYGESFHDDVAEELEAMEHDRKLEHSVVGRGHYVDQLSIYLEHFTSDQVLVVDSAKMRAEPHEQLRQVEQHLGLEAHSWSDADVRPRFVGGYDEGVPDDAADLLAEHYRPFNSRLEELTQRSFAWR